MSLLQDALQREQGGISSYVQSTPRHHFADVLAWLLTVLLFALAGVASWQIYQSKQLSHSAESSLTEDASAVIPAAADLRPVMVEVVAVKGFVPPAVLALYDEGQRPVGAASLTGAEEELTSAPPDGIAIAIAGAAGEMPVAESSAKVEAAPLDVDAIVAEAERALARPISTEHSAPFLGELAQSQRDGVPTLRYEQHRFESAQPSAAVVLINGRELRAGDQLPSGVRLLEILPDSAVFDYQGLQFRLRALSSWVNF